MEAAAAAEEKVFVAVPAEPRAGQSTLAWALRHLYGGAGTTIVVTHVHVPPQMIPIMGVKFHADKLSPEPVRAFRRAERERAHEMLDDYIHQCSQIKVKCEKLVIEQEDAASGLVELIRLRRITKLVIAAAEDKHYSKKLDKPVSKTATEIMERADPSCKIWFVCKEQLVCTRTKEVQIAPLTVAAPLLPSPGHEAQHLQSPQEEGDTEMEPSFDDELEEARKAVGELMRRALKESCRRQKAEEEMATSLQKAQEHEQLYLEEVKKREELEAALARADREIARLRQAIQQKHDRGGSHGEIDS
ncbi:U-box domain-containing protein 33-like [Triticum urartu]|uniref:RING-type E3 ubiquitin transferase n=1 Tax=Triticum urartu TaxID=4572 RepID=A0A8R7K0S6_TRIUA|nr:U-box domain-containing protein 33-like [Triticum urartu]